jgi:hypothetical protein
MRAQWTFPLDFNNDADFGIRIAGHLFLLSVNTTASCFYLEVLQPLQLFLMQIFWFYSLAQLGPLCSPRMRSELMMNEMEFKARNPKSEIRNLGGFEKP